MRRETRSTFVVRCACVFLVLALVSCTAPETVPPTDTAQQPEIVAPTEELPTVPAAQEIIAEDNAGAPLEDTSAPAEQADPLPTNESTAPSITETYRGLIEKKVKYYAYDYAYTKKDRTTGYFIILKKDDWQVIEGGAWEINLTTKILEEIDEPRSREIQNEIEEMWEAEDDERPNYTHRVVNYFWQNLTTGEMSSCWVSVSMNSWNSEDCSSFNDSDVRIVYEGMKFGFEIRTPEVWLEEFEGKTPTKITSGITYKDTRDYTTTADRVEFSTGPTTDVLMYVHSGYGIPIEIQYRKDKKITKRVLYEYLTVNYDRTGRWYGDFLKP